MRKRNKEYFKQYYQEHKQEILSRIQKQQNEKKRQEELLKLAKHNPRYYNEITNSKPIFIASSNSDMLCCKLGVFFVDFD
jgi:hypothetical protein